MNALSLGFVAAIAALAACSSCHREGAVVLPMPSVARHYDVFAPPSLPAGRPLVIVLHGQGGSGHQIRKFTHFDTLAAREGFVVAYPDAIDHHWNDGRPEVANGSDEPAALRDRRDRPGHRRQRGDLAVLRGTPSRISSYS